tara:strand:- start:1416 stop:4700 length:3285 start_codon:yes stop_codon:yes gene_type:complete
MHIIFRDKQSIDESETPIDLDQTPSDIIFLSFSDSDLNAFVSGWKRAYKHSKGNFPSLRLANLQTLKHPLSVDTYIEKTLSKSKAVIIRLIGGVSYWEYGLNQVKSIAQKKNIALAVLPADGRDDKNLSGYSNIPHSTLKILNDLCDTGGTIAAHSALSQIAITAGIYSSTVEGDKSIPKFGYWSAEEGTTYKFTKLKAMDKSTVLIVFYKSFITSDDLNPIKYLKNELQNNDFFVISCFVPSLKEPESAKWIKNVIRKIKPSAIINATSFSCKGTDGSSPLDIGNVPVFQISLSTNKKSLWKRGNKGLSPTDMVMHVALPEIDGRIFAGIASFKKKYKKDKLLEFSQIKHMADKERIVSIVKKISGWVRLQKIHNSKKKISFILSTYPGKPWLMGHAVGLDVFESVEAILKDLKIYRSKNKIDFIKEFNKKTIYLSIEKYKKYVSKLNKKQFDKVNRLWGNPEKDINFKNGKFIFKAFFFKNCLIALQPERGDFASREDQYHDLELVPIHSYIAFYLWLNNEYKTDLILHVGAHGTLEWLPGKSVGLSNECWPEILTDCKPIIYPFIINDPGESAQAKRRINAITIGHMPPALRKVKKIKRFSTIESLLDEFSNAEGLDPLRKDRLKLKIKEEAKSLGLASDLGLLESDDTNTVLAKIDKFVCGVKDSQFGDGLHIYGRVQKKKYSFDIKESIKKEKENLIKSISGYRLESGPSGSPFRGRLDVLPSGRNLYSNDPLSIPSKVAYEHGCKIASEFLKKYSQDSGEHLKKTLIDLWGSATLRTAGEEFSMALYLLGVKPVWKDGSDRVDGIEILTLAELGRPRVDVTLRVSGLFRDTFSSLTKLYNQAIGLLSERYEDEEDNPFIKNQNIYRVFGPKPYSFGVNINSNIKEFSKIEKKKCGDAWIESSSWVIEGDTTFYNRRGIEERVKEVASYAHIKDLQETDILLSADYAKHQGGFLAAKSFLGGKCSSYNIDSTDQENPQIYSLREELAKIIYSRASNTNWIKSMFKHKYRGAAEIANTFDNICLYAHLTDKISHNLLDMFFEATLNDEEVTNFMSEHNPEALISMKENFKKIFESGLWVTKRNSIIEKLY